MGSNQRFRDDQIVVISDMIDAAEREDLLRQAMHDEHMREFLDEWCSRPQVNASDTARRRR